VSDIRARLWLVRHTVLGRHADGRLLAISAATALCLTLLALATAAAPAVAHRQTARLDAISPMVDRNAATDDDAVLRVLEPEITNIRRWNGRRVVRDFYVRGASDTVAPGLPRMPASDEYYASPDLAALVRQEPGIAALFGARRLVGTIDERGLAQPHELRAIVGAEPTDALMSEVKGFGGTQPLAPEEQQQSRRRLNLAVAGFVVAMIWIPGVALLVILARLAASQRRRRTRSLRLIGLSRADTRLVHALEAAVVALPAAAVAGAVWLVLADRASRLPGTDIGFFPEDLRLPWLAFVITMLVPPVVVCGVAAWAVDSDGGIGLAATPASRPRVPRVGLSLLAAGGGLLVAAPVVEPALGFLAAASLWLGCALVASGLALAGPTLVARLMRTLAGRARSGARLLGSRLSSSRLSTSLRLGSLLSVLVILLLGGNAFASVLNGGRQQDWNGLLADQAAVPVVATDLVGELSLPDLRQAVPQATAVQQTVGSFRSTRVDVVVASCADLGALVGRSPTGCTGTPQWLGRPARGVAGDGRLSLPDGTTVPIPAPEDVTTIVGAPSSFAGSLLVPLSAAPAAFPGNGSVFFLLADRESLMVTLASISGVAPLTQIDLGELDRHNPDTQEYPAQIGLLALGAGVGLGIGAVGLVAAATGEVRERRVRMRPLRILGGSRSQFFSAHMWATSAPLAILGLMATAAGALVVAAMHGFDERAAVAPSLVLYTMVASLLTSVTVGIATASTAPSAGADRGC